MLKLRPKHLLLLFFFGLTIFLTFNRHSKSNYSDYHSVIWSDKAGYYIYLPSLLIYDFSPENFPENIVKKTGNGFLLEHSNQKVFTKYTYGVALLQLPFFLIAHCVAEKLGFEKDGFSPIYHWSIMIASVFYLLLGLLILKSFILNYLPKNVTYLTLFFLFAGTNLYYYSIDEVGMSHVYSFFLFSSFLYFTRNYIYSKATYASLFALCIIASLIILVRPLNIIFLSSILFLDTQNFHEIKIRIKRILTDWRLILMISISLVLVFMPQLIYWYYLEGKSIIYSYKQESFNNWNHPKLLEVWFSTNNGLLLYSPIVLIGIIGIIYMLKNNIKNALFIGLLFLVISYSFGSWWSWHLGCAFGHRGFVEYYSLLCLPFGYVVKNICETNKTFFKGTFYLMLVILSLYNLKMTYSYDGCWYGGDWDFNMYYNLFISK